ncbi:anthranilate synthase component II [Pseudoalteromonas rhizosphaerae]|uniref:Anthranilate synthase component II n=1 Tax=Pseudoalteromonas rhizosphaerae TaxID=2518973 RepID=A0ABW8L277_9GAMM
MLLMIDNYDSFTYNLVHYIAELGQDVKVVRNDEITLEEIVALAPDGIIISPGPFGPEQAGISCEVISHFAEIIPILGVCLGHQSIAHVFGAEVIKADTPKHGKCSPIHHDGTGIFAGLPSPLTVARYHSLTVSLPLPICLEVTAMTESNNGEIAQIMAIKHTTLPIYGMQFHPESIASQSGKAMLKNWINEIGIAASNKTKKLGHAA